MGLHFLSLHTRSVRITTTQVWSTRKLGAASLPTDAFRDPIETLTDGHLERSSTTSVPPLHDDNDPWPMARIPRRHVSPGRPRTCVGGSGSQTATWHEKRRIIRLLNIANNKRKPTQHALIRSDNHKFTTHPDERATPKDQRRRLATTIIRIL